MKRLFSNMLGALPAGEGAFIPFVVLGDPTPQACLEIVRALVAGGADGLELGLPARSPRLDGRIIQAAHGRARAGSSGPSDPWSLIRAIGAEFPALPIALLVYSETVMIMPRDRFYLRAAQAGANAVLVADLDPAGRDRHLASCRFHGLEAILSLGAGEDMETRSRVSREASGFVYLRSRPGPTGPCTKFVAPTEQYISGLRNAGSPVMVGFGIHRPSHVSACIRAGAAGVICGSAIVSRIAANLENRAARLIGLDNYVSEMKMATRLGDVSPELKIQAGT